MYSYSGVRHYYNKYWYIVESIPRLSWFKPSNKIQKKVEEKIINMTSKIKARIKQIKKDNRANKELKNSNKQGS